MPRLSDERIAEIFEIRESYKSGPHLKAYLAFCDLLAERETLLTEGAELKERERIAAIPPSPITQKDITDAFWDDQKKRQSQCHKTAKDS